MIAHHIHISIVQNGSDCRFEFINALQIAVPLGQMFIRRTAGNIYNNNTN